MPEENNNDIYNEDELHAPEFLNEEFFENVLKKKFNSNKIKITKLDIMPGTTKADHYASIMFRAKVHYKNNDKEKFHSMIIKTTPIAEGKKKDLLQNFDVFGTEIAMYAETLPQLEDVLRKYGDKSRLSAKILHHSKDSQKFIVFDDLTLEGYTTINGRWCTMEEVKLSLTKLAKLHAMSYKAYQEGDENIANFKRGILSNEKIVYAPFVKDSTKHLKELLGKHDDLKKYISHIEAIEKEMVLRALQIFKTFPNGKRDGILVLNHGDFHMKNMMIHEGTSNKLEDLMLLDYQMSFFGSPALDLIYAYYMLFSPEMREKHSDELYHFYFKTFQNTLKLTEYKGRIPTMLDLQLEFLKHRHWDLFLFICFMTFSYVFSSEKGDLVKAVEDEDYRRSWLENPEMLAEIRRLLPMFLHKGYFEEV